MGGENIESIVKELIPPEDRPEVSIVDKKIKSPQDDKIDKQIVVFYDKYIFLDTGWHKGKVYDIEKMKSSKDSSSELIGKLLIKTPSGKTFSIECRRD